MSIYEHFLLIQQFNYIQLNNLQLESNGSVQTIATNFRLLSIQVGKHTGPALHAYLKKIISRSTGMMILFFHILETT